MYSLIPSTLPLGFVRSTVTSFLGVQRCTLFLFPPNLFSSFFCFFCYFLLICWITMGFFVACFWFYFVAGSAEMCLLWKGGREMGFVGVCLTPTTVWIGANIFRAKNISPLQNNKGACPLVGIVVCKGLKPLVIDWGRMPYAPTICRFCNKIHAHYGCMSNCSMCGVGGEDIWPYSLCWYYRVENIRPPQKTRGLKTSCL
jgi:hypothetical protein